VWMVKNKGRYAHCWRAMWGQRKMIGIHPCWQHLIASREHPTQYGGIFMMGIGPFSGGGVRVLSPYSGCNSTVVPQQSPKECCAPARGKGSGSVEEHGSKVVSRVCSKVICVWYGNHPNFILCSTKRRHGYPDGLQQNFLRN
jgi:hypothetical protein